MNNSIGQIVNMTPGYRLNEQAISPLSEEIWSIMVSKLKPAIPDCTEETKKYSNAVKAIRLSCKAIYSIAEFSELNTRLVELVKKQEAWDAERGIYDYYGKGWMTYKSVR